MTGDDGKNPAAERTLRFLRRRDGGIEPAPMGADPKEEVGDETTTTTTREETPPDGHLRAPVPDYFGITDAGLVRPDNQDQFLIANLESAMSVQLSSFAEDRGTRITAEPPALLLMVADGIGGHRGGEVASQVVVDGLAHHAFTTMPWLLNAESYDQKSLVEGLQRAINEAQERIRAVARRKGLDARAGTTLTMAYVAWPRTFILHAGDSRAYLYRDGTLTRLTKDHTMAQELVERELMTEEAAAKSRFSHVLMNAVGGGDDPVKGEFHDLVLERGDRLLLCSDGLSGPVSDDAIAEVLGDPDRTAEEIGHELVKRSKDGGGDDNVTVVLALY
ncbi:MAG TPA: protein phosphatase 2C domain-containing protein [Polyangiaceae bacterium LLY-WYZ-14_1]|nr:protein phosphatase 2C domain-containing protein [Polyangiaceae bacterium LLY-WYZ-14_1]